MLKRLLSNLLPIAVVSIILGGILNLVYPVADYIPDRLTDLTFDVNVTSPANNELLTYNNTSSKWENKANSALSTALTSGKIFVGNASDIATGVAMTGDVNITSAGVTAVTDDSHAHTGTTLSSIDISADTNLAVTSPVILTDDNISIQQSNSTQSGYLSNTDWSTFNNKVATTRTINTTSPLSGGGDLSADRTFVIQAANATQAGALSSADWTTFNNKQDTLTTGDLTTSSPLSFNNTRQVIGGAAALSIQQANTTQSGFLSDTDWDTFNNKQAALGFTPENSANKGVASGYASLNASALVLENPVNATSTATASKIPIADGSGKLDTWITLGTSITEGELSLSDVTTGDFNTTQHGFAPKGTNLGKYLKDDGTWGTPSGTGAPTDATYITQTTNVSLSAEQALASLSTGIMKVTTTTGVISSLGDPLPVANGGTGIATATAYGVVCAGTTSTGAFQVLNALGSSGQVLTSNGAGALPTWQAASGGANTALSNLASVAINTSLIPNTQSDIDLGSSSKKWQNIYLNNGIDISNSNVKLLMHADGVDASTTFTDSATYKTITAAGDAQVDTAQSKFGGASLLCDGTGDNLSLADSTDWFILGSGTDFTVDFWVRFASVAASQGFLEQYVDGSNEWVIGYHKANSWLRIYSYEGGAYKGNYYCSWSPSVDTWYHLAFVRSGSTQYIFIDGVSQSVTEQTAWSTPSDLAASLTVGVFTDLSARLNGWIDELEIIKGTAKWTANFTPPTTAYSLNFASNDLYVTNRLGIGTTTPSTPLDILAADNATAQTIKINAAQASVTASDTFIDFRSTTGSEGSIAGTASAGVIAFNTFTGSHYTQIIDKAGLEPNMLLEIVDEDIIDFPRPIKTYEIDEIEKDINGKPIIIGTAIENALGYKFPIYKKRKVTKTETLPYKASPKGQLFKTRICQTKGSKSAVGVYLGTDKEGRDMVGSIGTGFIWVANKGKNIDVGDYLESSNILGCAELQSDILYKNTTVAKATESIAWKQGEIKRLIRCVYLGG